MKLRNIIIGGLLVGAAALSGCGANSGNTYAENSSVQETKEEKTVTVTISGKDSSGEMSSVESGDIVINTDKVENSESRGSDSGRDEVTASKYVSEDNVKSKDMDSSDIWNSKDRDEIFSHDFTEDIKKDVAGASASSISLSEELSKVEKVTEKYDELFKVGEAQFELNMASGCIYMIWDEELNSLWKRFSAAADASTKERVLKDERNWIAMKEEVLIENIGSREDGGSMYPMLENAFLQKITENRCAILASELAKIKGESFTMPERDIYGTYVDNQGTGDVYSSLIMREGWENENEAIISIYRVGETSGTFTDKGNGELSYESGDGTVKGIIRLNGWKGASFEVTEAKDSVLTAGDKFDFGFAF
ncbi:lysozyme inhibitor LprI family protein [Oribacterium sp. P6A1]|uniref:lysozyme inhibitor LprI family protein n=1 Tax=Oribacterium sp. P6A1 TaxID=1410612 RepID=UPI00068F14E2|nr:lysozyme inhibitor LprI family protein [Oribacterium sp. P6A1]